MSKKQLQNYHYNNYDENTKIKILAKYLLTKGVWNAIRLQKMLFMLRFEEVVNNVDIQDSYFNSNYNFQAWINGPVNLETYYYLRPMFLEIDEKDHYLLNKAQVYQLDQIYQKFFEKWDACSDDELIDISHTNGAWIQARQGINSDEPCINYLDEESWAFLQMIIDY